MKTRFHTLVANRISVIREASNPAQWRYIHTSQNPADNASRGLNVQKLRGSESWLTGPEFLWKAEQTWIPCEVESTIDEGDPEIKRETSEDVINVHNNNATSQLITDFSDWKRLKMAIAWILKITRALLELSRKRKATSVGCLCRYPSR